MSIVIVFIGLLFLGMAFMLNVKNAKYLLSGYNTLPETERKRIDIQGLVQYFRKFHIFLGVSFMVFGIILTEMVGTNAGGIFLAVYPIVAYIYYLLKTRKYATNTFKSSDKIGIYVLVGTLSFIFILFGYGSKENRLIFHEEAIEFKGIYGEIIPWNKIVTIETVYEMPDIKMKINGFSLGEMHKGYYRTSDGEKVKLLLNSEQMPQLLIQKKSGERIFYSAKEEMNEKIFHKMDRVMEMKK